MATSFGIALGLWPYYTVCAILAILVWTIVVLVWRYISLASVIAAVVFPIALILAIVIVADWSFSSLWPLLITAVVIPIMVIFRHRENLKRLTAGTESKVLQR